MWKTILKCINWFEHTFLWDVKTEIFEKMDIELQPEQMEKSYMQTFEEWDRGPNWEVHPDEGYLEFNGPGKNALATSPAIITKANGQYIIEVDLVIATAWDKGDRLTFELRQESKKLGRGQWKRFFNVATNSSNNNGLMQQISFPVRVSEDEVSVELAAVASSNWKYEDVKLHAIKITDPEGDVIADWVAVASDPDEQEPPEADTAPTANT